MPLPSTLVSTYQQYKQDTNVVASWLANTGMMSGYPDDLLRASPNSGGSTGTRRAKGKARKQKKPPRTSGKHILATKNFVPLAEFIVDQHKDKTKDAVDVPLEFSRALERAITVRRGFATLLAKAGATLDMTADETHNFFVGVLEKVRDALKPLFWQETATTSKGGAEASPKPAPTPTASANIFDLLEVYDAPEIDLTNAAPAANEEASEAADKAKAVVEYESEATNTAADRFMAFLALGRDLNALREQVKSLWKSYGNREISLSSVAVATNVAIALARDLEESVAPLFKPGGVEGMIMKLLKAICAMRGVPLGTPSVNGSYPFDIRLYDTIDLCMVNALIFLNGWRQVAGDGESIIARYNGKFGWYDKTVPYYSLPNEKRFEADRAHMMEIFKEFDTLGRLAFNMADKFGPPVLDEMSRGIHLMLANGLGDEPTPLWLLLATSLHLDVVRILGDEIDRPFREMEAYDAQVQHTVDQHLKFHREPRPWQAPGLDAKADKALTRLKKDAEYWCEGSNPLLGVLSSLGIAGKPTTFLKRHAMYCGLWVADMRCRLHQAGLAINYSYGSVLYAGHLYNALQAEGLVPDDKKWHDMELFFDAQGGRDTFFIGKAPSDVTEYHKQISLVMGFSAGSFTPNTRNKGKLQATQKGPRTLQQQGRVSMLFCGKFTPNSSHINLTADDIQAILHPNKKTPPKTPAATPVQLVSALAHTLEAEKPALMPDYLHGHRICWTFFRRVRDVIQDDMVRWLGPDWITKQIQLPFAAGYIFRSLCGDSRLAPTRELLNKAAQAYNEYLYPDTEEEVHSEISNKINMLEATAVLRKVEPDPSPLEREQERMAEDMDSLSMMSEDEEEDGEEDDYDLQLLLQLLGRAM